MSKLSSDLAIIILAAGNGTRMKSSLPKVMHQVANKEMVNWVIDCAKELAPKEIIAVINPAMNKDAELKAKINANFAVQKEQKGTADAFKSGLAALKTKPGKILILYGDTPMLTEATLQKMLKKIEDKEKICVLAFECEHENGYGRLVLDEKQNLERIVEVKDASALEKKITLCNSGVIAIHSDQVLAIVAAIKNRNAAGEFYLTDIIEVAKNFGVKSGFVVAHSNEVLGVNSKVELAIVEKFKQNELRKKFMDQGVTLVDPDSVYFSSDTKIEPEVIIYPSVFFGPNVSIKRGASIRSFSHIEGANIAELAVVGPFARIRPGSEIEREARVGNFVEVKKSVIKKGAKVNHLSYIGDAEIGEETNIGAGTITCNYDGYRKFKTKIGKKVFIGSNTALIAPLQIADEAIIAAGSVITKNVGKDELAIARASQTNISNGGKKYHQKKSS